MQLTFLVLAAVLAVALGAGQYYVPRSYYVIDEDGHQSEPVSLRRLRRSAYYPPYYPSGRTNANANAAANADGTGSGANANAIANANANGRGPGPAVVPGWGSGGRTGGSNGGSSGWSDGEWQGAPAPIYVGAANPGSYGRAGAGVYLTRRSGTLSEARSLSAGASVDVNGSGMGHFDEHTAVGH